ncbi:MAG: MerR family transcriptional regulator [Leptospirales bacterium]|nr:MerR family transcriptional regulator [Leptospirales bacterium]
MFENSGIFIGQLSTRTGLSRDTLRFYEKEGILRSKRLANNYRVYGHDDVDRLRFVENARATGFSLREVKEILDLVGKGRRTCADYEGLAQEKLGELDRKIAMLQQYRSALEKSLACCRRDGQLCDSLPGI